MFMIACLVSALELIKNDEAILNTKVERMQIKSAVYFLFCVDERWRRQKVKTQSFDVKQHKWKYNINDKVKYAFSKKK